MKVVPIKSNLERVMEVGDGAFTADQEPPPDHRTDVANPDVDLVDCDPAFFFHSTVKVSGNSRRLKQ
jgi:hypothetical protein